MELTIATLGKSARPIRMKVLSGYVCTDMTVTLTQCTLAGAKVGLLKRYGGQVKSRFEPVPWCPALHCAETS